MYWIQWNKWKSGLIEFRGRLTNEQKMYSRYLRLIKLKTSGPLILIKHYYRKKIAQIKRTNINSVQNHSVPDFAESWKCVRLTQCLVVFLIFPQYYKLSSTITNFISCPIKRSTITTLSENNDERFYYLSSENLFLHILSFNVKYTGHKYEFKESKK